MANTPNIRFKGFADDWEQRKLGEIVSVCSGKDYKHLDEGDIPVYGAFKIYGLSIVPFLPIPIASESFDNASETLNIYPPVPYTGMSPSSRCL